MPNSFALKIFYDTGYGDSGWVDASSFVSNQPKFPITSRNNDGSPNAKGLDIAILNTFDQTALIYANKFKFYINNVSRFLGTRKKKYHSIDNRSWVFEVSNSLIDLDDFTIDYATLNSTLMNTIDPYKKLNPDNEGYSNVSVPWLLETLMTVAGLPVDASDLYTTNSNNLVENYLGYSYYLRDYRICEAMLYALNQDFAMDHVKISADNISGYSCKAKQIKFFKLFNFLAGIFLVSVRFENDVYVLTRRPSSHSSTSEMYYLSGPDKYKFEEKTHEAKSSDYQFSIQRSVRQYYYQQTPYSLGEFSVVKGSGERAEWINNLVIFYQDKTLSAGNILPSDSTAGYYVRVTNLVNWSRLIDSIRNKEREESIEGPLQSSFYNITEHLVDPRTERSIIRQGVFI